jgi:arabinofuranosyltransferase
VVVILRFAWLSDDAYITFRVVDNAAAGLGLRWNPAERVQAYTHPLWLFMLLAGRLVSGELYYTAIALSVALSVVAVWLLAFRLRAAPAAVVLGLLALTLSRAFVDYATSGLENALSHLLLAAFLVLWFKASDKLRVTSDELRSSNNQPTTNDQRLTTIRHSPPATRYLLLLSFLAALLALNRLDALLLVLPALAWALWRQRTARALGLLVLGFLPLVVWTAFSLFYYGFPFPNTAYAKLATGIAAADLARQGVAYLFNSLRWDPLTLTVTAAAVVVAMARRWAAGLAVAAGIVLYLLYVVSIGGDFMSGRFLTLPLLAAVALLLALTGDAARMTAIRPSPRLAPILAALVLFLAAIGHLPVLLAGSPTGDAARRDGDIADERAYYTPHTGLFADRVPHPWAEQGLALRAAGPAVVEHGNVGFLGYHAGPAVHIIDRNGLTDPLLARLPVRDPADWRIGHFRRDVPAGYADTLRGGQNVIQDANLAAYFDVLSLVTRGPLWNAERLGEVWQLSRGAYDHLLPRPIP